MLQIKIKSPQQAIALRDLIYKSGRADLAEVLWQLDDHLRDFEELMQNGIQIKALSPRVDTPEPSGILPS